MKIIMTLALLFPVLAQAEMVVCKLGKDYKSSGTAYQGIDKLYAIDTRVYFKKARHIVTPAGLNLKTGECGLTSRLFRSSELSFFEFYKSPSIRLKVTADGKTRVLPIKFNRKVKHYRVQNFRVEKPRGKKYFEIIE